MQTYLFQLFPQKYKPKANFQYSIYYLAYFICDDSRKELLKNEDLLSLFNHYKTEEELIIAEREIKDNIKNKTDDAEFWKDSYCLAKYLKYKKYLEDLYDNFINIHALLPP